jgi:hypothetical protein
MALPHGRNQRCRPGPQLLGVCVGQTENETADGEGCLVFFELDESPRCLEFTSGRIRDSSLPSQVKYGYGYGETDHSVVAISRELCPEKIPSGHSVKDDSSLYSLPVRGLAFQIDIVVMLLERL